MRQVLQQLRAAPVVGRIWGRDVFPLRMARYDGHELAALAQSGEVVWVGAGGVDPRRARIRFLFRGEGSNFLEVAPKDLSVYSDDAQRVYAFLQNEGALFQSELQQGAGLAESALEAALLELVMAGLVTNDSLAVLQRMVQQAGPRSQPQAQRSSLEDELAAAWVQAGAAGRRAQAEPE
ncbi:MAG: hypothetical protein IPK16_23705 [Anaerolineales bacterium]|nr:hypothetical protein [Anaerolineales bacterium]